MIVSEYERRIYQHVDVKKLEMSTALDIRYHGLKSIARDRRDGVWEDLQAFTITLLGSEEPQNRPLHSLQKLPEESSSSEDELLVGNDLLSLSSIVKREIDLWRVV